MHPNEELARREIELITAGDFEAPPVVASAGEGPPPES